MSDARINNPYAELDGQGVRGLGAAAALAAREPARAPSPPRGPPRVPRPAPDPTDTSIGSPLTLRPLAALRPPPPPASPQVEQLLRGVIISEEEVRVICER